MEKEYFNLIETQNPKVEATERLNSVLKVNHDSQTPVLLLLSGGSSLDLLSGVDESNFSPQTTVTVLDERYSTNPAENNMAQVAATDFFEKIQSKNVNIIDTRILEDETQEQLANRFNTSLLEWIDKYPNGKIVATVGIGPDGHISGIMPYPEDPERFADLFEKDENKLAVNYNAGDKNQYPLRVTTTINFLRKIDTAVVYVVGESKRDALEKVKNDNGTLAETPARILRELKGDVYLFTDIS